MKTDPKQLMHRWIFLLPLTVLLFAIGEAVKQILKLNEPKHRDLQTGTTSSNTNTYTISGTGVNQSIFENTDVEVIVTVWNSSGNLVTYPTEVFSLKVSNRCSMYQGVYCYPYYSYPLSRNINVKMTNNNNGTYSATYKVESQCDISVQRNGTVNFLNFNSTTTDFQVNGKDTISALITGCVRPDSQKQFQRYCDYGCYVIIDDMYMSGNWSSPGNYDSYSEYKGDGNKCYSSI